jgi:hypothetical protein
LNRQAAEKDKTCARISRIKERILKIEEHSFSLAPQFIAGIRARFRPKPFQRF